MRLQRCALCSEHTRSKGRHHNVNGVPVTPEEVAAVRARQQVGALPAKFPPNHLEIPTKFFNAPQAVPSCVSSVFPAALRPGRCRVWPCDRLANRQLFSSFMSSVSGRSFLRCM